MHRPAEPNPSAAPSYRPQAGRQAMCVMIRPGALSPVELERTPVAENEPDPAATEVVRRLPSGRHKLSRDFVVSTTSTRSTTFATYIDQARRNPSRAEAPTKPGPDRRRRRRCPDPETRSHHPRQHTTPPTPPTPIPRTPPLRRSPASTARDAKTSRPLNGFDKRELSVSAWLSFRFSVRTTQRARQLLGERGRRRRTLSGRNEQTRRRGALA
jgi:hypothetical protein